MLPSATPSRVPPPGVRLFGRTRPLRAFTLLEVLVVVVVIALLISILLPTLSRARAQARTVVCLSQIQQLARAAFLYKADARNRLPGTGVSDVAFYDEYVAGKRRDWISWAGTWGVNVKYQDVGTCAFWKAVPRSGRLWSYYRSEKLLRCPSAEQFNGKFSYSIPENVSMAMPGADGRYGLPPIMDKVRDPSLAILFLDEDEQNGLSNYSVDDGFGAFDLFADRHMGKATVAFFDGHAEAHYFARGHNVDFRQSRYSQNISPDPFEAWMIQIAPFNCRSTPRAWQIRSRKKMPKFNCAANFPSRGEMQRGPGCE